MASGYTIGTAVGFLMPLVLNDPATKSVRTTHMSLGGREVSRLQRIEYTNSIQTVPIKGADVALMDMFCDSISAGEAFSANLDAGTSAGALTYKIVGDYKKSRFYGNFFQYQLTVRKS